MKHIALPIVTPVLIWWTANTVTSIASKRFMECKKNHHCGHNPSTLTEALKDLRWIDLSCIQLAASALFTLVWLKLYKSSENTASVSNDTNDRPSFLLVASFVHVVGILATNVSCAAINSSTTQMIKTLEPLFTCGILFFLKDQKNEKLSCSVLFSLLVMSAGTCLFVAVDSSFNTWGVLAAHLSVLAFSIRNYLLNNLNSESQESPSRQNYFLSLYGLLFVLPMAIIRLFVTNKTQFFSVIVAFSLAGSYFISNVASIQVLEAIGPSSHAMLDLFKRVYVIIPNVLYFSTPMHGLSVTGFSVFAIGLLFYYITSSRLSLVMKGGGFLKGIVRVGVFLFSLSFIGSLMFSTITTEKLKRLGKHKVLNSPSVADASLVAEQQKQNVITSPWAYSRPIPEDVIQTIETWNKTFPCSPVHVLCGTFKCVKTFSDVKRPNATASFLTIGDLVENTIFESWFHRSPLNKVLGGVNFEDHLQQVVLLALAWRKGGTYIDPRVKIQDKHPAFENPKPWIAFSPDPKNRNILGLFNFSKEHLFIKAIGQVFLDQYEKDVDDMKSWPMDFTFQDIILKTCKQKLDLCPKITYLENRHLFISDTPKFESSFGTLSYDSQVRADGQADLDNEILGFPGLQFVPFVNEFLDRNQLHHSERGRTVISFLNAWWGTPSAEWPPAENIDPIMLSMQIGEGMKPAISKNIEYLRKKSPIGCRDATCIEFLKKQGVDAFFSGCLTLLMNPTKHNERSENIYFVDVNDEVKKLLPLEIQKKGILLEHMMKGTNRYNKFARAKAAYNLIENYSKAKLVITQRIQSALLCVAMGTPVIFIISPKGPGKNGNSGESSLLTQGFSELFYTVDLYKNSSNEAKTLLHNFNWRDPRPSPSPSLLKRLRATSWNVIRQKKGLHEAALKFGVIPFPNLSFFKGTKQDVFHLIFTTNNKDSVKLLIKGKSQISGSFNWKHWRCIESIFYHHPFAKVIVHTNTLPYSMFDVLKESGYDIEVQRYTLKEMLHGTPAESFVAENYDKGKKSPYWYAHEADLLRYAILYKFGGCYLDTDAIFVRSIRELPINAVGYQDDEIAIGLLYFEKNHPALKKCLEHFAKNYDPNSWAGNGPTLITNVLHSSHYNATKLGKRAFYMFHYEDIVEQCFQQTSGKTFEENMKVYKEEAFNVHLFGKVSGAQGLNEKLKERTICKHLLNSFCVLCNNLH